MKLLIDIGNSRLKWATASGDRLSPGVALDYRQTDFIATLRQMWLILPAPSMIAIASVAARQVLDDCRELAESLWPNIDVLLPRSTACAFGVSNAYAHAEKLGVDRWLALAAAHRHYPGKLCVTDCGTAITVDAIDADGRHLGGLIAPGLITMQKSLAANTADLVFHPHQADTALATATEAAIANGALLAACGLIEKTLRQLDDEYRLILTGGDAEVVAQALSCQAIVDTKLVFKGLALACLGEKAA